jgi:xanthosine utilization system XapX-like protein
LISIPVNCVLLPAVTIWMREKSYQPWLLSIVGALGGYVSPYIVAFIEPLLANQPMLSPPLNAPRSPLLILAVPAAIAGYFCARLFRPLARGASLFG